VDVEAPVFGRAEEARGNKEAEGDGNDQVDGVAIRLGHLSGDYVRGRQKWKGVIKSRGDRTYIPTGERVSYMDREAELVCKCP
jgi:hypothetical protein